MDLRDRFTEMREMDLQVQSRHPRYNVTVSTHTHYNTLACIYKHYDLTNLAMCRVDTHTHIDVVCLVINV